MDRLDPTDLLWLQVLERDPSLREASAEEARKVLEEGGFPELLIQTYLQQRHPDRKLRRAIER